MPQPLDGPQALLTLRLCSDTFPPLNTPNLSFAIITPTQQVFSTEVPIQSHDPAAMSCEVCNLLSRLRVIQCNDPRVTCSSQVSVCWGELHGSDGFDES